jgi:hypothetical protein
MTIHTPEHFKAMTDNERLELLETMGKEAYGNQWKSRFARESGWSRRTLHNWMSKATIMPIAAIVQMQDYARRRTTADQLMRLMGGLAKDLRQVSINLNAALGETKQNLRAERERIEQLTELAPDDDELAPEDGGLDIDESQL